MLRITKQAEGEQTVLRVEGKLVPPWVEELENCWRQSAAGSTPLIFDLRALTFVGTEGKELLARVHGSGVKLLTSGITMKAMIEQLETESDGEGK